MQQKNNQIAYVTKKIGTEESLIDQSKYESLGATEKLKYQKKDEFIQQWQEYFEAKYPSVINLVRAFEEHGYLLQNYIQNFKDHVELDKIFKSSIQNMKSDPKLSSYNFILSIASDSKQKYEKSAKELLESFQIAYQAYQTSKNVNQELFDFNNFYERPDGAQKIQAFLKKVDFDNNTVGRLEKIIHQALQSIPQNEKVYSVNAIDSTKSTTGDLFIGSFISSAKQISKIGLCFAKINSVRVEFGCFENDELRWGCVVTALSKKSYTVFVGSFAKGLIEGKGKMYGRDDCSIYSEYEGEFQSGKRYGMGIFEWYDEENYNDKGNKNSHFKSRYTGEWKAELYNGKGKLEFYDKFQLTILEGQFQDGELIKDEQATITINGKTQQLKKYIEQEKNKQNPMMKIQNDKFQQSIQQQQKVQQQPFQFPQNNQEPPKFPTFQPQQQPTAPQFNQIPPQSIQPNINNKQPFPNPQNSIQPFPNPQTQIQPQVSPQKQFLPNQAPQDNQYKQQQQNNLFLIPNTKPQETNSRNSANYSAFGNQNK